MKYRHYRDRVHWNISGGRVAQNKLRLWREIKVERQEGRENNKRKKNSKKKRNGRNKREAGRNRNNNCKTWWISKGREREENRRIC